MKADSTIYLRAKTGLLPVLFALVSFCFFLSCEDRDDGAVHPDYPIQLTIVTKGTHVELNWQKTTVSSFSEYIIVRSAENIVDSPAPDPDNVASIIARIDDIDQTSFEDSNFPLTSTIYYKVYADIGDHFLYSRTIEATLDFISIPLRLDAGFVDKSKKRIIGFDSSNDLLFEYDYAKKELIHSAQANLGFPLIRIGNYLGSEEIYLYDNNGLLRVYDRNSLAQKNTFSPGIFNVTDFEYSDGFFFISYRPGPPGLITLKRSNGQTVSSSNEVTGNDHKLLIEEGTSPVIYDVGLQKLAKFSVSETGFLNKIKSEPFVTSSSLALPSFNHAGDRFVGTNQGHIFDKELNHINTIKSGGKFFNLMTFTGDDKHLVGTISEVIGNVFKNRVLFYDMESFELAREINIPFSNNMLFADGDELFLTGVVFFNNQVSTIIIKINTAE